MRLVIRQDYDAVSYHVGKSSLTLHPYSPPWFLPALATYPPTNPNPHPHFYIHFRKTAKYVKERIKEFAPTANNPFVLGLPTGSSPVGVYRNLVKFHQNGELSFKHIVTFNMDEYVGLPR